MFNIYDSSKSNRVKYFLNYLTKCISYRKMGSVEKVWGNPRLRTGGCHHITSFNSKN